MGERISNFTRPIVWYPSKSSSKEKINSNKTEMSLNEKLDYLLKKSRQIHEKAVIILKQHAEIRNQLDKTIKQQEVAHKAIDELEKKVNPLEENIKAREIYTSPYKIQKHTTNILEEKSYPQKDSKNSHPSSKDKKNVKTDSFFRFLIKLKRLLINFIMRGDCNYKGSNVLSNFERNAD